MKWQNPKTYHPLPRSHLYIIDLLLKNQVHLHVLKVIVFGVSYGLLSPKSSHPTILLFNFIYLLWSPEVALHGYPQIASPQMEIGPISTHLNSQNLSLYSPYPHTRVPNSYHQSSQS